MIENSSEFVAQDCFFVCGARGEYMRGGEKC